MPAGYRDDATLTSSADIWPICTYIRSLPAWRETLPGVSALLCCHGRSRSQWTARSEARTYAVNPGPATGCLARRAAARFGRRDTDWSPLAGQAGHDQLVPPRRPERPSQIVAADLRRRIAAGEWEVTTRCRPWVTWRPTTGEPVNRHQGDAGAAVGDVPRLSRSFTSDLRRNGSELSL